MVLYEFYIYAEKRIKTMEDLNTPLKISDK